MQGIDAAEPGTRGNPCEWPAGRLQQSLGAIDPGDFYESRWGRSGLLVKDTRERALAHAGSPGQCRSAEVADGVGGDVRQQPAQTRRRLGLDLQGAAELGLSAGSAHEQHELLGYRKRSVRPAVGFDQRQAQVDARRNAGGGKDRRSGDEDRIGLDLHLRPQLLQPRAGVPVRRRAPAVEETSGGQHECAGADAGDAACRRCAAMQPWQQAGLEDR